MKLLRKFRGFFRKEKLDAEMSEEVRAHLELQTQENIARGMSTEDARFAALRQFGGVEQIKERCRDVRRWGWVEDAVRDLRYGTRSLRKNPGFATTAVLTLALGIGVNAALFIYYDIVALRTLPSRDPERLVEIFGRNEKVAGRFDARFSYPDYLDLRAATRTFSDVIAVGHLTVQLAEDATPGMTVSDEWRAGVMALQAVSDNYFSGLGGEITLGRDFLPEESKATGGRPVIVISHSFWQRRLRSDPAVLGRTLKLVDLRSKPRFFTIIGVAGPEFVGQTAVPPVGWVPVTEDLVGLADRLRHAVSLVGRLKAGVSEEEAKADLDVIVQQLAAAYRGERRPTSVELAPAMRMVGVRMTSRVFAAMSPVVLGFLLVLIISCLNVANLLLARGVTRQHEIGVRLTLGAGRWRVARQLFMENLLLCGAGAAAGMIFGIWMLHGLRPFVASMLEGQPGARVVVEEMKVGIDGRIVAFTALLALVAGVTAGLGPALHASRGNLFSALKNDGSVFGRRISQSKLRQGLIVGQLAICLTLLSVSGIFVANVSNARARGTGFETERIFTAHFGGNFGGDDSAAAAVATREAIETLRTLPGVEAAGAVERIPLRLPRDNLGRVSIKAPGEASAQVIGYNRISPGFFDTLGIGVVAGRTFTEKEEGMDAAVVIVTESAARRLWPGESAIGQSLGVNASIFGTGAGRRNDATRELYRDCEVVGIVRDFASNWNAFDDEEVIFLPLSAQRAHRSMLLRARVDSAAGVSGIVNIAAAAGIPLRIDARLSSVIGSGILAYRLFAWVSAALAGIALMLAVVGLYGIMAFAVNQRVREIGVRMALGASTRNVVSLFVRRGMRLVVAGLVLGLIGGFAFTLFVTKIFPKGAIVADLLSRFLVFGLVAGLLAGVALLACWLPARRAAKVNPMVALRAE